MNPLDDLISSSAGVPGVTPDVLGRGRAELEAAIAASSSRTGSAAVREAANRWWSGARGKSIIGVVAMAAVAAVAAVIIIPSSSPKQATSALANSSGKPAVKAPAKAPATPSGQAAVAALTYSVTPLEASLTSAYVLAQAARGAQSAQYTPEGNVPLVNGWPNASYWHTVTELTSSLCPGQANLVETWLGKPASGVSPEVVSNRTVGSVPAKDRNVTQCEDGPTSNSTYPVGNVPPGPFIGGQQYTWAQFAALPTNPAALWPILQADSMVGVAPYKGVSEQGWLYSTIMMTLEQDPVAPAMRVALLSDAEKISGVTVAGEYTDSMGRAGIALRITGTLTPGDTETTVIDTGNGQVLADIRSMPGQQGCTVTKEPDGSTDTSCVFDSATLFISANPTNTAPQTGQPTPVLGTGQASPNQ